MSRTVRFGDSSSSSGGGSRGSGNNRHSDSGVGSFSDQASRTGGGAAHPDRAFTAKDYDTQRNDIRALQEALDDAKKSASHYKSKAQRLDAELSQTRKDLREKEAQWRGLFDRSEQLEEENKKLVYDKRDLANTVKEMSLEVDDLRVMNRTLQAQLANSQPIMTNTMPPPPPQQQHHPEPKLHRTTSKKEKVDPDKKRLSKRFERDTEGSDSSGGASGSQPPSSMKPPRPRRRDSYVEPWGPPAPPSHPSQRPPVPPSPSHHSRHLDGYIATSQQGPPVIGHQRAPTFSNVPRSAGVPPIQRPTVTVPNPEAVFYDDSYEDGNYHPYPLPAKQRRAG